MAAYKSSSLVASDHDLPRHSSGHIKNTLFRKSKQDLTEKKMFGKKLTSHGNDFQIGKKFKSFSKMHGMGKKGHIAHKDYGGHAEHKMGKPHKGHHEMNSKMEYHGGSVSPSPVEFDDMMKESVTHDQGKKKSKFSRKFFG